MFVEKPVRKAVRTYLIRGKEVVAIRYNTPLCLGFYDIPGGKIENGESSYEASVREFKEKTGMDVVSQHFKGNVIVDSETKIFDFDIWIVDEYEGSPCKFYENDSMWISIDELLSCDKIFSTVEVIKYLDEDSLNLKISEGNEHKILKLERS